MPTESHSDEWQQPEDWQSNLESQIRMAMPVASSVERERILYEAAYQRGRRSMRVPSFLAAVGSCAATLLIAWCTMTFPNAATLNEPIVAEMKAPIETDIAITPESTRVPVVHASESLLTAQRPTPQRLSVVSLRGASSRMPIEDWLRELDRVQEVQTDMAPAAEPNLRPRTNIDLL